MKLGQIEQQPGERRSYSINYSNYLDGDRVEQAEAVAQPDGLVVEAVGVYDDGQRVRFWVRGGQDGGSYKATITVKTVGGEVLQDELTVKIKEV